MYDERRKECTLIRIDEDIKMEFDSENTIINETVMTIRTHKCEECDKEFCELWLWCKGKNVEV